MLRFTIKRLLNMVFVLFAISIIVFLIFNVLPGGGSDAAATRIAGRNVNQQLVNQIKKDYGFNDPIYTQYYQLMKKTVKGDLESYSNRVNVREQLIKGIPATASLCIGAAIIWVFFGLLFGLISAVTAGRWPDRLLTILGIIGISLPVFWIAALMLYYLTYKISLFPAGGYVKLTDDPIQWANHLILPWIALSILFIGFYSRLLRSNILDTINEDYVRTARAKGLTERRVLTRHVLRNALIPIVTLFGLDFAAAFGGGAILTEKVFGLQGVGQYVADSIGNLDLPPVMGTTLYGAFFIVLFNALVDIAYAFLDPRIRLNA
jgi:peptide/nickel transport system permease protein